MITRRKFLGALTGALFVATVPTIPKLKEEDFKFILPQTKYDITDEDRLMRQVYGKYVDSSFNRAGSLLAWEHAYQAYGIKNEIKHLQNTSSPK